MYLELDWELIAGKQQQKSPSPLNKQTNRILSSKWQKKKKNNQKAARNLNPSKQNQNKGLEAKE